MLIDEALKDLEEKRERFLSWRKAEMVALAVKKKFSRNGMEIGVGVDWITGRDGVEISVYRTRSLEDLRPIFRFLGRNGYERKGGPVVYGEMPRVTWRYDKIKLTVYFNSGKENACKFHQTGTRKVPIYEIDCPGLNEDFAQEKQRAEGG